MPADPKPRRRKSPASMEAARQYQRVYYQKNKEKKRLRYQAEKEHVWAAKIERVFGITADDYYTLLEAQGNGCAICGGECATGRRLSVDHDHRTGSVRGILCGNCNKAIGLLGDDTRLLHNAADYLIRAVQAQKERQYQALLAGKPMWSALTGPPSKPFRQLRLA